MKHKAIDVGVPGYALTGSYEKSRSLDRATWQELVGKMRAGDEDAGQRLVQQSLPLILRAARTQFGTDLAYDAMHEAVLSILKNIHKYNPRKGGFLPFAYWQTMKVCRDMANRLEASLKTSGQFVASNRAEVSEFAMWPWNDIMTREDIATNRRGLYKALCHLTKSDQNIIALYYFEGRTDQAIADSYGLTNGVVAYRRNSALAKLKRFIVNNEIAIELYNHKEHIK